MVRRPVKPVLMPKSIRPGASLFSEASALAATGAMRLDGISTPVPSLIRAVFIAAAAIATKGSALSIWVSKNQALLKPSSSARRTRRQESAAVGMAIPNCMDVSSLYGLSGQRSGYRPGAVRQSFGTPLAQICMRPVPTSITLFAAASEILCNLYR